MEASYTSGDERNFFGESEKLQQNIECLSRELSSMISIEEAEHFDAQPYISSIKYFVPKDKANYSLADSGLAATFMPAYSVLDKCPLIGLRNPVKEETCERVGTNFYLNIDNKRQFHKYPKKSKYDYADIVLDYALIGISGNHIKMSSREKLLLALQDCYNAIDEPVPFECGTPNSIFESTFCSRPVQALKSSISISLHVKDLNPYIHTFLSKMKLPSNMNKLGKSEVHEEFRHHWEELYLDIIKLDELKGCQLDQTVEENANHLESLLRNINSKIRFLRLLFVAYNWFDSVGQGDAEINNVLREIPNAMDRNSIVNHILNQF